MRFGERHRNGVRTRQPEAERSGEAPNGRAGRTRYPEENRRSPIFVRTERANRDKDGFNKPSRH